jgi:hypothetical protein
MDRQAAIITLAQKKGLDPANLTRSQFNRLAMEVSISEKALVGDGIKVLKSKARTSVPGGTRLGLRVLQKVQQQNLSICRGNPCGRYYKTTDGKDACTACGCSGRDLENKAADAMMSCPIANPETRKPYWSNLHGPQDS